jgi:membrane protein implicated in regulation of membrane protease activity
MDLTTWWLWMAAALIFAILEVVAPGYVLLGFAVGAAVTGGLLWVGGAGLFGGSLPVVLVSFAVLSLVAWIVLRRLFDLKTGSVKTFEHDINDN